jgi:hypothetical protein
MVKPYLFKSRADNDDKELLKAREYVYFIGLKDTKDWEDVINGVQLLGQLINIMIIETENKDYHDYKDFIGRHNGIIDNKDIVFISEKSARKAKKSLQNLFNDYVSIGGNLIEFGLVI